jgi:hypothetical protein
MRRNVSRSIAILAEAAFESPLASSFGVVLAVVHPTYRRADRKIGGRGRGREGRKMKIVIVIKALLEQNRFHTIDNLSMAAIHSPKLRQGGECCDVLGQGPAPTGHG